jgi:hypothetical protein
MFRPKYESKLDDLILSSLEELDSPGKSEDEKSTLVERASKLEKLKSNKGLNPPSLDTVLIVGANLFGILWLARYEKDHVIRSPSAFKFILRP